MKELHPNEGLRIFDIKWQVTTAGPSPNNNERIEVFLLGCDKAMSGNPCKGCFNSSTWNKDIAEFSRDPIEVADMINNGCDQDNKYITIGGGEPLDQVKYLIPFLKRLKEHDFHIIVYTWRQLDLMIKKTPIYILTDENKEHHYNHIGMFNIMELLRYIDILIDGEFVAEEKLLDFTSSNTAQNFVGSGNQIVWDLNSPAYYGYKLKDINDLTIIKNLDNETNVLIYSLKEDCEIKTL